MLHSSSTTLVENSIPAARPVRKAGGLFEETAWLPKQDAAGAIAGMNTSHPLRNIL